MNISYSATVFCTLWQNIYDRLIFWYFFSSCWSDHLRVKVNWQQLLLYVVQSDNGRGKTNWMCILQSGVRGRIGEDDGREAATTSSTLAEEGPDATIRKRNGTVLAKSFWLQHSAQHAILQCNVALYISFYPVPNSIQQIMQCYPPLQQLHSNGGILNDKVCHALKIYCGWQ